MTTKPRPPSMAQRLANRAANAEKLPRAAIGLANALRILALVVAAIWGIILVAITIGLAVK